MNEYLNGENKDYEEQDAALLQMINDGDHNMNLDSEPNNYFDNENFGQQRIPGMMSHSTSLQQIYHPNQQQQIDQYQQQQQQQQQQSQVHHQQQHQYNSNQQQNIFQQQQPGQFNNQQYGGFGNIDQNDMYQQDFPQIQQQQSQKLQEQQQTQQQQNLRQQQQLRKQSMNQPQNQTQQKQGRKKTGSMDKGERKKLIKCEQLTKQQENILDQNKNLFNYKNNLKNTYINKINTLITNTNQKEKQQQQQNQQQGVIQNSNGSNEQGELQLQNNMSSSGGNNLQNVNGNLQQQDMSTMDNSNAQNNNNASMNNSSDMQYKIEENDLQLKQQYTQEQLYNQLQQNGNGNIKSEDLDRLHQKLARNRESARNSRKRKKVYIELLESKVANLNEELSKTRKQLDQSKEYMNKINSHNQILTGFVFGRQQLFDKLEKSLKQSKDDNELNLLLDSLRFRLGATGKERVTAINHFFKQMLDICIPTHFRYMLWTASEGHDIFCQDLEQKLIHMEAKITDNKAKLIEQLQDVKDNIQQKTLGIENQIDDIRTIMTPEQSAKFLLFLEKNKYRREISNSNLWSALKLNSNLDDDDEDDDEDIEEEQLTTQKKLCKEQVSQQQQQQNSPSNLQQQQQSQKQQQQPTTIL